MVRPCSPRVLALALALGAAAPAAALLDVPTSDRTALSIADLASGSGIAHPVDVSAMPFDDAPYAEALHSLRARGLVDPAGARRERRLDATADGALHLEFLAPVLELRPYVFGSDVERRTLYHSSGDTLHDGFNTFLDASGSAVWGPHVGGAYDLQVQQDPDGVSYRTKRLYVKGVLGKWSLKVGRDAERLGPGYHGSLLLDDTARTFDLWRVRTEQPLFLPEPFTSVGGFRFSVFNAYLHDGSPRAPDPLYASSANLVEDARLLGMRFSYHPTSWLDLGISRAILYGGRGRASYDSPNDFWKLLTAEDENVLPGEDDDYDNDQYAVLDITVRLPLLNGFGPLKGGKVYWEHGGTDIKATWQGDDVDGVLPWEFVAVSDVTGLQLSTAVTDLRFEFAEINDKWYKHNEYSQGYSYRGVPLGHHAGPDSRNWFFELSRYFGPAWRTSVTLDLESRGRSTSDREERTEWGFGLEARRLRLFGLEAQGRLDALVADVNAGWDDPAREDRTEYYVGVGVTVAPWEPVEPSR